MRPDSTLWVSMLYGIQSLRKCVGSTWIQRRTPSAIPRFADVFRGPYYRDRRAIPLRILYNLTPYCTPTLALALARRNPTSISQPIYRPIRQVLSHLINQLINPSVNQSISQSMNESVSQSINRPISHSVNSRSVAVDFNSILQICIRIGAGRRCAARGGAPPHWRRFYKNRNRVFGAKT